MDEVIRALKYRYGRVSGKSRSEDLREALTYFQNQRSRMNYYQYAKDKVPIGSGVVEAANKTLVSQRLKLSGQSWGIPGGQGVLTCRALFQSERWEDGWAMLASSFRREVLPLASRKRSAAPAAA